MSGISRSCDDSDPTPTIVAVGDQPESSTESPVAQQDRFVWVDGGSGPGYLLEVPMREPGQ